MILPSGIILAKEQLDHSYTFWTMPILIFCPVQIIMGHPLDSRKIEVRLISYSNMGQQNLILTRIIRLTLLGLSSFKLLIKSRTYGHSLQVNDFQNLPFFHHIYQNYLQLKEYETDPWFLQLSQNLRKDSLLIYMFFTICKHEIVFILILFHLICTTGRTISCS